MRPNYFIFSETKLIHFHGIFKKNEIKSAKRTTTPLHIRTPFPEILDPPLIHVCQHGRLSEIFAHMRSCTCPNAFFQICFILVAAFVSQEQAKSVRHFFTICKLETPKRCFEKTVNTQMKCSIMLHFIRDCTVCQYIKTNLRGQKYTIIQKILALIPKHTKCTIKYLVYQYVLENPPEHKGYGSSRRVLITRHECMCE